MNEYTGTDPGFPVSEERDSYQDDFRTDSWSPSVTLRCPWGSRYALIAAMIGRAWPHSAGRSRPIATGFRIAGDGELKAAGVNTNTQIYQYQDALVTVQFERAVAPTGGGGTNSFDFFTETIEPFIEYQRVPHNKLFWSTATPERTPLSPEEAPSFPLYRERYTRTYVGITLPLPAVFTTLQNQINTNPVVSPLLGTTYAANTVLYGNRRINYSISTDGTQSANLTLDFTYRQETWRKYWNFDEQMYLEIQKEDGTAIEFPPAADLSPVLMS